MTLGAMCASSRLGVRYFEDYDFPTLKTVNHVGTTPGVGKSAWFKDPDGNTVALFQPE